MDQDVTGLLNSATSTPEEAGQNIAVANQVGTTPDAAKSLGSSLTDAIDQATNLKATPDVADFLGRSLEHAALGRSPIPSAKLTPDGRGVVPTDRDAFNAFDKISQYVGATFKGQDIARQVNTLAAKKANGVQL
jgi:hypothetical protein